MENIAVIIRIRLGHRNKEGYQENQQIDFVGKEHNDRAINTRAKSPRIGDIMNSAGLC